MKIFIHHPTKHEAMGSIREESYNQEKLNVDDYVQYLKTKENIREFLNKAGVGDFIQEAEKSINGLTIDIIVKYSVDNQKNRLFELYK